MSSPVVDCVLDAPRQEGKENHCSPESFGCHRFAWLLSHAATWSARCAARPGVPEAVVFVNLMRLSMSALRSVVARHCDAAIFQVAGEPSPVGMGFVEAGRYS